MQEAHPISNHTRLGRVIVLAVILCGLSGCRSEQEYPTRPITIVCPWAAGGGTDRVSRQIALQLERDLSVPVTVINATGGKGVTGHNRGLSSKPDGYTMAMMTFELNTMHWMGLTELTYEDCIPLFSVNEDYAALFVHNDAPWETVAELTDEVREHPNTLTASGTAVGGAWHLALAGWLTSQGCSAVDVTWIPSAGANPSLQLLMSGGIDMVCCSLPEARTLLEAGEIRALGVMSPKRASGFEQVATFQEQGVDWTLGGWRGLALPLATPQPIVDRLQAALQRVLSATGEGSFQAFMQTQKFDHTSRPPDEFRDFLEANDAKLGLLLSDDSMKSLSQDRFSPMAYPIGLIGVITICLIGLAIVGKRENPSSEEQSEVAEKVGVRGLSNFVMVVIAISAYMLFSEALGFLLVAAFLQFLLMVQLGAKPIHALLVSVSVAAIVYVAFGLGLRVPLPAGWLG